MRIKIINAKTIVDKGEKAKVEAQRIVADLKQIKENICPTCVRPEWITDNVKIKEAQLLSSFENQKI